MVRNIELVDMPADHLVFPSGNGRFVMVNIFRFERGIEIFRDGVVIKITFPSHRRRNAVLLS